MAKKINTFHTPDDRGRAEVYFDFKEELAYIQYYDDKGHLFYTEEFPDHSLPYVQDAAENWSLGIKKLENI